MPALVGFWFARLPTVARKRMGLEYGTGTRGPNGVVLTCPGSV